MNAGLTDDFDNVDYAISAANNIFDDLTKNKKIAHLGDLNQLLVYLERQKKK